MIALVSRKAVLDALEKLVAGAGVSYPDDIISVDDAERAVKELPVANPDRLYERLMEERTAKWQWVFVNKAGNEIPYVQCDHCKRTNKAYATPWCPHCGYRMENKQKILDEKVR